MNNYWLSRKEKVKQPSHIKRADKYAAQRICFARYEYTRSWLEEKVDEAYGRLLPYFQEKVGAGFDKSLRNFLHCLVLHGDLFLERVCNPKDGKLIMVTMLPPETVFRIQTTKGQLVEFQQSKEGPDYASLVRVPIDKATEQDFMEATALRFKPEEIVHVRLTPYDVSGYGSSLLTGYNGDLIDAVLPKIEVMTGG